MSIEDRLGNKAESWVAEPGDSLIGKIVKLGTLEGDYGPYPYVEIKDKATGEYRGWHAFDTVAKNELAKNNPAVGDDIGLFFFGKKLKKGRPEGSTKTDDYFKDWQVEVEKASGESAIDVPDWGSVGQEAAQEADQQGISTAGTDGGFGYDEYAPTTVDGDGEPF